MTQGVCLLGATGSIGTSTLTVMAANNFRLVSASAYDNVERMLTICQQFKPEIVVMVDDNAALKLSRLVAKNITVLSGSESLTHIASHKNSSIVVAGIVGSAGLKSTMAAIVSDKKVLLANKESLVMAGSLMMSALSRSTAQLLPVDSEHNAIFQCLPDNYQLGTPLDSVNRILLTGSGGPFLKTPVNQLKNKTVAEAINHPNWTMGAKISVDSATMMNKGLEWLEAKFMFGVMDEKIEIIIHPQSIIHSMVEYKDGSVLAQLGQSDMKIPIAFCLGETIKQNNRINSTVNYLDFSQLNQLTFHTPDFVKFPALRLTQEAWTAGGTAMTILNAANEVAVAKFLNKTLKFTDIMTVVEQSLTHCVVTQATDLQTVIAADADARSFANAYIKENIQ